METLQCNSTYNVVYKVFTTTLDKTCWGKSWKSSKFKKWLNYSNSKFFPLLHNVNVESSQVFLSKAENFANNIDLGGEGFFHWKIDFLFCLNSFVQDCRLLIFLKKPFQIAQWYCNACWCNVCFKFNQFQVIKVICMN